MPWTMEYRLAVSVSLAGSRTVGVGVVPWTRGEGFPCNRNAGQSCWYLSGSRGLLVMPLCRWQWWGTEGMIHTVLAGALGGILR